MFAELLLGWSINFVKIGHDFLYLTSFKNYSSEEFLHTFTKENWMFGHTMSQRIKKGGTLNCVIISDIYLEELWLIENNIMEIICIYTF